MDKAYERLSELGFHVDPEGNAICSYKYQNISIDIMPSESGHMGEANKWYKVGFKNLLTTQIDGEEISILTAPCFLATKFEAFNSRGTDYRTSHDFEDIIYLIDNRTSIVEEIKTDKDEIRKFLIQEFGKIMKLPNTYEILSCHIHPLVLDERFPILEEKINRKIEV